MNDKQFISHKWLSRMWDADKEIAVLSKARDKLLEQGVGSYDNNKASGSAEANPNEARLIEYSYLSEQIEKKARKLANENIRTLKLIDKLANNTFRSLLISRYIDQASWEAAGKLIHYEKSQAQKLGVEALEAIYEIIPKGEIILK